MNLNVFCKHSVYSVDVLFVFDTGGAGGYVDERMGEGGGGEEADILPSISSHADWKDT